ncbi:MAG: cytochrome c family protein, partial [Alphaproteobacteria bacterium]|nr:cytochrome c family protein [Alphaproteobacteria bacterium]
ETTETAAVSGGGETDPGAAIAGDPAAGKQVFRKCRACHVVEEGKNRLGPSLHAIIGRDKASVDGFKYSDALTAAEGDWTVAEMDAFLGNPKGTIPGNRMTFPGLKDAEDRTNVIAYLNDPAGGEGAAAPSTTEAAAATTEESQSGSIESTTESGSDTQVAAVSGADFSAGDAEAGKKVFRKCRACHKVEEGKNGVGPSLFGVIGRDKGSIDGFKYSDAMLGADGDWTASDLNAYLENPKAFIPGNRMSFPGLKMPEDRVNVIVFLNEADGSPDQLE